MAWITIARNTDRPMQPSSAEPDAAAARVEAFRAARFASNRIAAERVERALRAAEQDAAGSPFPTPATAPPVCRRPVA